jgi:hypothetical protein
MDLWDIEMEPEVRAWLESLPKRQFGHVLAFAEKLAKKRPPSVNHIHGTFGWNEAAASRRSPSWTGSRTPCRPP